MPCAVVLTESGVIILAWGESYIRRALHGPLAYPTVGHARARSQLARMSYAIRDMWLEYVLSARMVVSHNEQYALQGTSMRFEFEKVFLRIL